MAPVMYQPFRNRVIESAASIQSTHEGLLQEALIQMGSTVEGPQSRAIMLRRRCLALLLDFLLQITGQLVEVGLDLVEVAFV